MNMERPHRPSDAATESLGAADAPTPAAHPLHAGIELGRTLAVLLVVYIHQPAQGWVAAVLGPLSVAAVPYFFVTSGHFLAVSGRRRGVNGASLASIRRVLRLWWPWMVIYSVVPLGWLMALKERRLLDAVETTLARSSDKLFQTPVAYVLDGPPTGFHLWFLPSLALAVAMIALLHQVGRPVLTWAVAGGLFVVGLMVGDYRGSPLGAFELAFNTRNGPFQSLLLVLVGFHLGQPRRAWPGLGLVAVGVVVFVAEQGWLAQFPQPPAAYGGFSLAVLPMGVGAFLVAGAFSSLPLHGLWVRLGALSLPVYLGHLLLRGPLAAVVYFLWPDAPPSPMFLLLFLTSLIAAALAVRSRAGRWLLTGAA